LLESGRELEAMAPARLRLQLAMYRLGGEAILDAIASANYNTASVRPTVSARARVKIAISGLLRAAVASPGGAAGGSPGRRRAATPERPGRGPRGDGTRPFDVSPVSERLGGGAGGHSGRRPAATRERPGRGARGDMPQPSPESLRADG